MDIQSPPGYYMKFFDDIQPKSIPSVLDNANGDINSQQLGYLISLVQEDGTSQVVQISEEEANLLGIFSNGISETNTTPTFNETIQVKNDFRDHLELTNTNPIVKPIKHATKAITRRKKNISVKNNINCNNDNKQKQTEINIVPNPVTILHTNESTQHVMQLTEDEAMALGVIPNGIKNNTVNNYIVQKPAQNGSSCTIKQPVKTKSKSMIRKKLVSIKKVNQEQKSESSILSYSTIIPAANGSSSQVVPLPREHTKLLGILSNGTVINCSTGTNVINSSDTITQNAESIKVKQPVKVVNKSGLHHKIKKVVNIAKTSTTTTPSNESSKQAPLEINLLPYSSTLLKTQNNSQIVELSKEEAAGVRLYVSSNQATTATEEVRKVTPPSGTENKSVNHLLTNSNKAVFQQNTSQASIRKVANEDSSNEIKNKSVKPLGSCENPIEIIQDGEMLHSTQNLSQDYLQQIAKALKLDTTSETGEDAVAENKSSNVIYRVVYPEELDLNPKPIISLKPMRRGRPKKRSLSEEGLEEEEQVKPMKNVRTRSGRITRPPKHIKQDFKKIDTSEVDNMETELKTVEFEPLKTNQPPSATDAPKKLNLLENHQRKRSIAAQFRCPKCQKAYLGHSKMLKHLQKHPDHGPIPEHCKPRLNNDTWNFLIDLSNKNPSGQRGLKFCKELVNFLQNVRILAKVFFKRPTSLDKNMYFVDDNLSSVLGIETGSYILNENELHKEINLLALIKDKNNHSANLSINENHQHYNGKTENFDLEEFVKTCQTDNHNLEENINFTEAEQCTIMNSDDSNKNSHVDPKANCILDNINFQQKLNFDGISNSDHNSFNINCDISSVQNFNAELHKFNEHIMEDFSAKDIRENNKAKDSTTQAVEENTHEQPPNPEISLHNELLSENSLLSSLPNLRNSVEELMLNSVDTAQVTNLLENSTSSDEVMNVDQFVNERFKNLTESDLELPNHSLNLDLPSLDLFQFHTS